jgi:hypothetical protein
MGIVARDTGGEYEPIPIGLHRAICINVFDIGFQPGYQGKPPTHKVVILWELEAKSETTGKHFTITKIYTLSIGDKSNLGADLTSWRGKAFTEEERAGFDLDNIKNKACQLNVVPHNDRVKIASVLPAQKVPDPETKKNVVAIHWKPETPMDYIPNFVSKMIADQFQPPEKTASSSGNSDDAFLDDIPF